MGINLKTKELSSRVIRKKVEGDNGLRVISTLDAVGSGLAKKEGFIGGTLKKIGGALFGGLKGFAFGVLKESLKFLTFSFTRLFGLLLGGISFIYNYNWNISDKDIDAQVKQSWINFAGVFGGELGESIGFFTCGVLPSAAVFAFNEPLGLYLLARIGEEFAEELALNISIVLQQAIRSASTTAFSLYYKNIRKILKHKTSPLRAFIPKKILDSWGKQGGPVVSFSKKVEDFEEAIPNPMLRAFGENFREGLYDGCVEAGYILAGALDSWYLQQKKEADKNREEIIEIIPNRDVEEEKIILSGSRSELKPAITTVLATHQLIQNRDVGAIVANDVHEWLSAQRSDIMITIEFQNVEKPPIKQEDRVRVILKIPHVTKNKLDWITIKSAAGKNGYDWGRFKAIAVLDKGGTIQCYGATSSAAKSQVESLATLSSANILKIDVIEETNDKVRATNKQLQKKATRVWPYRATIMHNRVSSIDGRAMIDGKKRVREIYTFKIWNDSAPSDFNEKVAQLFTK